jgi:predicted glutamine amidotransferase
LRDTMEEVLARPSFGAINFLLSDGDVLYAHRHGRTLFLLERQPHDEVRTHRESIETGAEIVTPWTPRRHAIFIASEHITDEPWQTVPEGSLIRMDRTPEPVWRYLRTAAEAAQPAVIG